MSTSKKYADSAAVKICLYNGHLILTVLDKNTPKIRTLGLGQSLTNFNEKDLLISEEALTEISKIAANNKKCDITGLEFITKNNIWWASNQDGIILKISEECIRVYAIPKHTICKNEIDPKLKLLF